MAQTLTLCDEYGIIYQAMKILPNDQLKISFLEALAELEDNECHKTRKFPKTRLHKVKGVKQAIYRADVDKISGWRIHVQYVFSMLTDKFISRTLLKGKDMMLPLR